MKTFIFQNTKKNQAWRSKDLMTVSTLDILASGNARNLKKKQIYIQESLRRAHSDFCSFIRWEFTSKTMNLYPEWFVQQSCLRNVRPNHP